MGKDVISPGGAKDNNDEESTSSDHEGRRRFSEKDKVHDAPTTDKDTDDEDSLEDEDSGPGIDGQAVAWPESPTTNGIPLIGMTRN